MQAFEGNIYGLAPDLRTKTISAENTWSDEIQLPGSGYVFFPVTAKVAGGAVVTLQARRPGESWLEGHDLGDTAGVANGTLLRPVSSVAWFGGWFVRIGVKTGALNGGSAVVGIGTQG